MTELDQPAAPARSDPSAPAPQAPHDDNLTTAQLAGAGDKPVASGAFKATANHARETAQPLLTSDESADFQHRWDSIQASFVDEPRRAVADADALVAGATKRLAEVFASERSNLEGQWDRGDDVSTEDLRVALRRYRSFFGRLLAV